MNSIRCGYCRRSNEYISINNHRPPAFMVPLVVTSRGQTYDTQAHPDCYLKWKRIADIKIIEGTEGERLIRERLRVYRSSHDKWCQKHRKPCPGCGYEIGPRSKHCITCANQIAGRTRKERNDIIKEHHAES